MYEFKCIWTECPTAHNMPRVTYVNATNSDDAEILVRNHVARKFGIARIVINECKEVEKMPPGNIIEDRE